MPRSAARLSASLALAGLVLLVAPPAASARGDAPAASDGLTTCQRAIGRIGAQMGHTLLKDADGGDVFVFVVRSTAGDYSVRCTGGTGTLGAIESCWKRAASTCLAHAAGDTAAGN